MTQSPGTPDAVTRRRRGRRPADGSMPLVEHIHELRSRLLIALAAIVLATIFGFWWYGSELFALPSLGHVLTGPYCQVPAGSRVQLGGGDECRLLATGPFEQFLLRLKVGATAGVVLASPVWLYELWAFIVPGLHRNERRYGIVFTLLAALLFVSGAVLAYLVVSHALDFLLSIGDSVQTTALSGEQYFDFILHLILIFGVSFEIPLLIAMLNVVGVVRYEWLKKARRGIILAVFVFAAVATPGQDPFSMLALAVVVCVLVEVAVQFARINDKRRARTRPDWMEVDDEHAAPLDSASGVGGSTPVPAPEPVAPGGSARPAPPAPVTSHPPAPTDHGGTPPAGRGGPDGYDDIT